MGNYLVNGEVIDVREGRPTAADLKRHSKSVLSDWVMASMPNGQIVSSRIIGHCLPMRWTTQS